MKKVLFIASVFVFLVTMSSSASIFSQGTKDFDNQMFDDFTITGNPDYDLSVFAKKNNLSTKEAKKILSKKFGSPKKPDEKYFAEVTKSKNPDIDLENFALANSISKDEAKIILQQMFGNPEMP